ncbi:hypothetical protein BH23ACT11_BH23ACT11_20920 [soil metagenome]
MGDSAENKELTLVEAGILAAKLLEHACVSALESLHSLQLETVRELAGDLNSSLREMSRTNSEVDSPAELLTETALRCADLANLAACNIRQLPVTVQPDAVASVYLAAGTVKACGAMVEMRENPTTGLNDYILRDIRSATWRADLAVR